MSPVLVTDTIMWLLLALLHPKPEVLVVLSRASSLTILESHGDGRFSYTKTILAGRNVAFTSIYAPNDFDPDFFTYLTDLLSRMQEFSLILGADMNATFNPVLDRSSCLSQHSQNASSTTLNKFIVDLSLTETFCAINPSVTQHSFYSHRLTLILIIYSLLPHSYQKFTLQ